MLTEATLSEAVELTFLSFKPAHNEDTLSSKLLFKHELIILFARSGS